MLRIAKVDERKARRVLRDPDIGETAVLREDGLQILLVNVVADSTDENSVLIVLLTGLVAGTSATTAATSTAITGSRTTLITVRFLNTRFIIMFN